MSLKSPAANGRMAEEGISVYLSGQLAGRTEKKQKKHIEQNGVCFLEQVLVALTELGSC